MGKAQQGDTVSIHYTGRLADGTVFDSSQGRDPLEFTLGGDEVIRGFEEAVVGMKEGERKTATVSPDEAYGPRREDLVLSIPRDRVPPDLDPEVGQYLRMRSEDGGTFDVMVAEVGEEAIHVDANHPLAGKELTFEIELVQIVA